MKRIFSLAFFVAVGLLSTVFSQTPEWGRVIQTNNYGNQNVNAVTADNSFNYIAASISGSVTFDGAAYTSAGFRDMLVVKMNQLGNVVWKKLVSTQPKGYIYAKTCKVDDVGNLYIVGYFSGTATIGTKTINSLTGDNSFLAKFNSNGDGLWVSSFSSTGTGINEKFVLDAQKNIYIISRSSKLLKFDTGGVKLWEQSYADKTLQGIAINGSTLYIGGVIM